MICELETYPQFVYDNGGQCGLRRWTLDPGDDVDNFVQTVCESHWHSNPDVLPESVEVGGFFEQVIVHAAGPHTTKTLGPPPTFNKTLVVARYRLHNLVNCWPDRIPKPWHPLGTTLTCKIRGSGEAILVNPSGFRIGGIHDCDKTTAQIGLGERDTTRIIIPITEYHISCDRMTLAQVNRAWDALGGGLDWDQRVGTVNDVNNEDQPPFLGCPPETLLFDSYEVDETYVPSTINPHRYRLTAVMKQRDVVGNDRKPLKDCDGNFIGWNHDFTSVTKEGAGWHYYRLRNDQQHCKNGSPGPAIDPCGPRFQLVQFCNLFGCPYGTTDCGAANDMGSIGCGAAGSEGQSFSAMCKGHDTPAPEGSSYGGHPSFY